MTTPGALDAVGTLVCLAGLCRVLTRPDMRRSGRPVVLLLAWTLLHSLCNTLEWTGVTSALNPFEDYLQILEPAAWAGFFYAFFMESEMARRMETERRLRTSEERLSLAVDGTRIGLWDWNVQTGEVHFNEHWAGMAGYSLEELEPHSIKTWERLCHPDDLVESQRLLEEHFAGWTEIYECEVRIRHKNGHWVWAIDRGKIFSRDALGRPVRMAGTHIDITAHKLAEDGLRASEEKFFKLFHLSPDAITLVLMQDRGVLLDVNEAFLQLFGYQRGDVVGRGLKSLGLLEDPGDEDVLQLFMEATPTLLDREVTIRRSDGQTKLCSLSCQRIDLGGQACVLGVLRDITESKHMQRMMVQTEKMLSVGGIAAGIAHEINNPLGIILQAAQNLTQRTRQDLPRNQVAARDAGLDVEALNRFIKARKLDMFVDNIQKAAQRAAAIVRHMLDFSRENKSDRAPCAIRPVIENAISMAHNDFDLKKHFDFRRVTTEVRVHEPCPDIVCNSTEIEQVILNLLRNAAQAMHDAPEPPSAPRIGIDVTPFEGGVRIVVEDNGPGIPEAVRSRIFEPFFTTKGPDVGTGLGLSVSYFIITSGHGGTIHVDSAPGQGTRFVIELPTDMPQTDDLKATQGQEA